MCMFAHCHYQISASHFAKNETAILLKTKVEMPNSVSTNRNQVLPALSSTGSILSNTDLSDLSTVGTCDIFVYQMRHRVM